ncbi:ATPase domain-containing protein [Archaeoglobus profundus]|uniref:Circadian clock protein, KaiC n=1 Tax=Archaeoglobus profundus (strain DSM 5631 / JCM 9629 / NBRC 100127 / Av18) TaxID=572546 RepID=D2RE70_ARCPA|nr:ATPase domain-containing protein [Archaeoglobus profundus]ADB58414.1 putative circadian clock protein, KaiC [Archaeoglobus profundus DSM 5631]
MPSTDYLLTRIIPGGFPRGSMILIAGEPGTGKTTLVSAIAINEIKKGKKVLFVSLNEPKEDYFGTIEGFGWEIDESKFKFVDLFTVGREALEAQLKLITEEIFNFKPDLIVIDSITALTSLMSPDAVRSFLHASLGTLVKSIGAVALLVAEKPMGKEELGFGVEEFVVDGVIILRYIKYGEHYRRVMEIPKMRRRKIEKPQYEYAITDKGIELFEVPELERTEVVTRERVTTGIAKLDVLTDGGFYKGSITVIAGQTGTGKTTFGLHFVYTNALRGHRAVFVTLEESVGDILRSMNNYGMKYESVKDRLNIISIVPESESPVSIFVKLKEIIENEKPVALVIDSYTALEEHMDRVELSKMVRYLQLAVKNNQIATILTMNMEGGIECLPPTGLSTLADNIILLGYDFEDGRMVKKMLILKSRASNHARKIYKFDITSKGVEISD